MRISVVSIPVLDQQKALEFYTHQLGFRKKLDIPLGNGNRWLTLVSPEAQHGTQLLLEPAPLHFEPAQVYQKALYDAGLPVTQFNVDSVDDEHRRLEDLGVQFSMAPTDVGTAKIAIFEDTCGNHIQIIEEYTS